VDWSPHELINPVSDNVDPVSGTARSNAYQRGNAQQWQRAQQSQRRRALVQRLSEALDSSDFAEAQQVLHILEDDEFFSGPVTAISFRVLEKALAAFDLASARQALGRLLLPEPEPPTRAPDSPEDQALREVLSTKDDDDHHGHLDVTV
jgi:hypothetical protein